MIKIKCACVPDVKKKRVCVSDVQDKRLMFAFNVPSIAKAIIMETVTQVKVPSERLEKPVMESVTPGLQGEWFIDYILAAPQEKRLDWTGVVKVHLFISILDHSAPCFTQSPLINRTHFPKDYFS